MLTTKIISLPQLLRIKRRSSSDLTVLLKKSRKVTRQRSKSTDLSLPLPETHPPENLSGLFLKKKVSEKYTNKIGSYNLHAILGKGTFSVVRLATKGDDRYAIKCIPKKILDKVTSAYLVTECSILKRTNHPNIISLIDTFETDKYNYIVLEYGGSDLYNLVEKKRLTEPEAGKIFIQIVNAVEYLHNNNISHRDLKLENILLNSDGFVKLTDFGLASFFSKGIPLTSHVGSEEYAAPEILKGEPYNGELVDSWALGIILYALGTGRLPFNFDEKRSKKEIYHKICRGEFTYPKNVTISSALMDLITNILIPQIERRYKVADIKAHEWFKRYDK